MRKTLIINAGSSSIKYKLYTMPGYSVDCEGMIERIGLDKGNFILKFEDQKLEIENHFESHEEGINFLLENLEANKLIENKSDITKVGHRVVQGGEIFKESSLIGEKELEQIYELAKLAPLHNKPNGDGIRVFMKLLPHAQNIAVFDTEFHQTMPPESYLYPVPYSWYEDYSVRRYGMHGTSHKYVSNKVAELENKDIKDLNIIVCHLGNGASLSAVRGGEVLTTSMGLTPLAGIMMGTRSGDIDPSIIEYMVNQTNMTVAEVTSALNKESGMIGISGISSDCRDLTTAMNDGNEHAQLTFKLYSTRIIETIGAYATRMGRVDVIAFTGGIGENVDHLRASILNGLEIFGVELDDKPNQDRSLGDYKVITTEKSRVTSWVVTTDEEYQIAFEAEKF